jgi:hypothetical protein
MTRLLKSLALVAVAGLLTIAVVELGCRLLLVPDERGFGAIMGIVLPPYHIVTPADRAATDRNEPYGGLVVDGRQITLGHVAGYHRYDDALGYTHLEEVTSVNGWWHSNNIGAREAEPTTAETPAGSRRWILLGESFAHGSSLPTDQGWGFVIEQQSASLDVVNLAVDGYSMAQAYLRYQSLADRVEHQAVMLMFVPDVDLWREVNTLRTLGEPWKVQVVMPRFVIEDDSLRLVSSPYSAAGELFRDNRDGLGDRLHGHLARYDRFWIPLEYRPVPILDHLVTFKMAVAAWGRYARGALRRELREPGSEALEITRRIFGEFERGTADRGRRFVALVLPTGNDLRRFREEADFPAEWAALVKDVCAGPWQCIDLAAPLRQLEPHEIDAGPDGRHYGPLVNRRIAAAVGTAIAD